MVMKELVFRTTILLSLIATALIGCRTVGSMDESASAKKPGTIFDPLSLPKGSFGPETFLDPLVFYSDRAYVIRTAHGKNKRWIPIRENTTSNAVGNQYKTTCAILAPATDAAFIGGSELITSYLKENLIAYIPIGIGWLQPPIVGFVVNEQGVTEDVALLETSSNSGLDEKLVELISNMPPWKPATAADGRTVKQAFEFSVIQAGC